jgi:hypothetical protein
MRHIWNFLPETTFYYSWLPRVNRDAVLLDDKRLFAFIARGAGIPAPSTLAFSSHGCIYDGEGRPFVDVRELVRTHRELLGNIVVKPALGSGGKNVLFLPEGEVTKECCEITRASELTELLLSSRHDLIVQAVIAQHPSTARFHPHSLNTLRVMTSIQPGCGAQVICAMLKLGARGAPTDNAHTGGVYVRVELETGRLDDIAYDEELGTHRAHPTTNVVFAGHSVPYIESILEMARRTAAVFSSLTFVGWDIACTPAGPVVLEGNASPGLTIIQRTHSGMVNLFSHSFRAAAKSKIEW